MSDQRIGVAISTTGDEHRLGFLETCVEQWDRVLPLGSALYITVDGSADDAARVARIVYDVTGAVFRVGQPKWGGAPYNGHMGVAVSKNTGLELLMTNTRIEHLFLCDDDTWPLNPQALSKHTEMAQPHSMVCWGEDRLQTAYREHAAWTWPRGVLLYTRRHVIDEVGGMDERFGPGGHEHVEWSRRIHQAGFTTDPFLSPRVYAESGMVGPATRAGSFWHCEDMRRPGEHTNSFRWRKRKITSVRRRGSDWAHINRVMEARDGDTSFVPFMAHDNSRASATLCTTSTGQGAGGDQ